MHACHSRTLTVYVSITTSTGPVRHTHNFCCKHFVLFRIASSMHHNGMALQHDTLNEVCTLFGHIDSPSIHNANH